MFFVYTVECCSQLQEASEVVKLMFNQMTRSDPGYGYFKTVPGQSIHYVNSQNFESYIGRYGGGTGG